MGNDLSNIQHLQISLNLKTKRKSLANILFADLEQQQNFQNNKLEKKKPHYKPTPQNVWLEPTMVAMIMLPISIYFQHGRSSMLTKRKRKQGETNKS